MLTLDKIRIRVADTYNITFATYEEVQNPKTKEKSWKWVESGCWYGTIEQCLVAIKDKVARSIIDLEDFNAKDFLNKLEELLNGYVKLEVIGVEDEKR